MHLGFNMKEISMWLGHGDIGTTMNLYAHLDMAAKRNIADTLNKKFVGFTTNKTVAKKPEEIPL